MLLFLLLFLLLLLLLRQVFTMDADRAKAVTEGFCRFHEVGP